MSIVGNRVRIGLFLTSSMLVLLILVMTHATPAQAQATSTVRVSNLAQPFSGAHWSVTSKQGFAQSFCSGSAAATLDKVRLHVFSYDADRTSMFYKYDPAPVVTIRADRSGRPGTVLQTLTSPVIDNTTVAAKDFTSSGYALAADTTYWVAVYRPLATGRIAFYDTTSKLEDSDNTVAGW